MKTTKYYKHRNCECTLKSKGGGKFEILSCCEYHLHLKDEGEIYEWGEDKIGGWKKISKTECTLYVLRASKNG